MKGVPMTENPMGTDGFEFVELGKSTVRAERWRSRIGFRGTSAEERMKRQDGSDTRKTGKRRRRGLLLASHGYFDSLRWRV